MISVTDPPIESTFFSVSAYAADGIIAANDVMKTAPSKAREVV
jgi:hypothetical protein